MITAWKRFFIEADQMFRAEGQYLTAPAASGSSTLSVTSAARFTPGDSVLIFDAVNDKPELQAVASVGTDTITLSGTLAVTHLPASSAYVGRVADGFFEFDLSRLYRAYDSAFIEPVFLPDGSHYLPWKHPNDLSDATEYDTFSDTWFKNGKAIDNGSNYVHVMSVQGILYAGDRISSAWPPPRTTTSWLLGGRSSPSTAALLRASRLRRARRPHMNSAISSCSPTRSPCTISLGAAVPARRRRNSLPHGNTPQPYERHLRIRGA